MALKRISAARQIWGRFLFQQIGVLDVVQQPAERRYERTVIHKWRLGVSAPPARLWKILLFQQIGVPDLIQQPAKRQYQRMVIRTWRLAEGSC